MAARHKMLQIFIDQTDRWNDLKLSDAIVHALERNGIAGATVFEGSMGYGVHRRVHKRGLFGVSDEKPVLILAVDEEAKIRAFVSVLKPMVKEGLITLLDVEVAANPGPTGREIPSTLHDRGETGY